MKTGSSGSRRNGYRQGDGPGDLAEPALSGGATKMPAAGGREVPGRQLAGLAAPGTLPKRPRSCRRICFSPGRGQPERAPVHLDEDAGRGLRGHRRREVRRCHPAQAWVLDLYLSSCPVSCRRLSSKIIFHLPVRFSARRIPRTAQALVSNHVHEPGRKGGWRLTGRRHQNGILRKFTEAVPQL